jgi:ATP-dependent DNA helicase RecQ
VGGLPPELHDQLLDYAQTWRPPADALALVDALREAHGPMLFLLDAQALALYRQETYEEALEVIERRQRRSATIYSQSLEARTLLAAGRTGHAQNVADDIAGAYPRHVAAVDAASEVYARLDRFDDARALIEAYLEYRPGNIQAILAMVRSAQAVGEEQLAGEYLARLGSGIPAGITDLQLQTLAALLTAADQQESARAVQLELERRRAMAWEALQRALAPVIEIDINAEEDVAALYRQLSGPESIDVSRKETRQIQLDAVRHFGFMNLREGQVETIATIRRDESILAVMPTGAGKSLCYQLPALTQERATLVISPLIALMKDQVDSLPAAARRQATFINSSIEAEELAARMEGIAQGKYKLIYAAPERLRQRAFLRALRQAGLDLFVVDEAHCVSLWGHDFRPDYLFIQEAREELGAPTSLAMTATAPPRVRDEIIDYMSASGEGEESADDEEAASGLRLHRPRVLALDIFRDNLHLSALRFHNEDEKLAALLKFVTETEGSGIVYVNSRHKAEARAYQLRQAGVTAEAYHAGMENRGEIQDRFMGDETRVVVATIAFGMGIDKADIRFIVHFHPSRSLAAYYQEVGRAGRDGKPSQGVLFYSNNDWANLRRWAKADEYDIEFLERVYVAVASQLGVKVGEDLTQSREDAKERRESAESEETGEDLTQSREDAEERRESAEIGEIGKIEIEEAVVGPVDARRLRQVLNADETTVRVAISLLERADLLSRSFDLPRELEIGLPRSIPADAKRDLDFQRLSKGLALRPGRKATFKTADIARFMGWPLPETEAWLLDMQADGWLHVSGSRRAMLIELPPRPPDMRERLQRLLNQSAAVAQRRIDDVIGYATAETCRHGYISAHFGSPPRARCDVCDNCTGIRPDIPEPQAPAQPLPDDTDLEPMILDCLISLPKPVGRSGLSRILAGSLRAPVKPHEARHHGRLKAMGEATIMNYIDDLLESGRLRQYTRSGYPVLAATLRGRAEAEAWLAAHPELAATGDAPDEPAGETAKPVATGDLYTNLQRALWAWRRRTAEAQGQPPYVIMSNDLMLRIAESRPQSAEELARLSGMGAARMEHYGPMILDLVQLNPPQPDDDELLTAQRSAAKEANKAEKQAQAAAVSPRLERQIFMKMQELRQKVAVAEGGKPYLVANNTLLKTIARTAPESREALEITLGFRSSGLREQADQIVEIVKEAREAERSS